MANYQALGFKCGLEIHQQISGRKLFCDCPTTNSDQAPDIQVKRVLRAVAGETGEVDIAAKHEMQKGKTIQYIGHHSDVCLVDLDEDPPHPLNQEALMVALQTALLLNADIVDEIQVMRKTVVDGSNVSGFQRTALIAMNGSLQTEKGKVTIPTICLEEEACQKVSDADNHIIYRLDRLGIPLIEIATGPEIQDPEQAKEVAAYLGMVLRSTGGAKRGLGSIRQDVNVSIKGGARTEIKGFQDLKSIPKVIEIEVLRQAELLKEGKQLKEEVRKAEANFTTSFLRPMPGASRLYPETDIAPFTVFEEMLKKIIKPKLIAEQTEGLAKRYAISKDLAQALGKAGKVDLFDALVKENTALNPGYIADTLMSTVKEVKRKHNVETSVITDSQFKELFQHLNDGKITKEVIPDMILDLTKGIFDSEKYESHDGKDLEKDIQAIIDQQPGLTSGAYMGLIMSKFKGRVDGKKANEILRKLVK